MGFRITRRKIQVFVIIILLALDIGIYLNSKQISPDKCAINFKSQMAAERFIGQDYKNASIKLIDLYEGLKNGECRVTWSKEGYRLS